VITRPVSLSALSCSTSSPYFTQTATVGKLDHPAAWGVGQKRITVNSAPSTIAADDD